MNINRDIYAAIVTHLHEYPTTLLQLSRVDKTANSLITTLFPIMLAKYAVAERKLERKYPYTITYQRVIPYDTINLEYCTESFAMSYILKWGSLYTTLRGYCEHITISIYNNNRYVVCAVISYDGKSCYSDNNIALSAARFVTRVFPGTYINGSFFVCCYWR